MEMPNVSYAVTKGVGLGKVVLGARAAGNIGAMIMFATMLLVHWVGDDCH